MPESTDSTCKTELYDFTVEGMPEIELLGRVIWYIMDLDWTVD